MEEISNMESEKNKIPQSKEIYLDGFNFIEKFFTLEKKSDTLANFWDLQEPFLKIKQLVSALRNSNYLLKVFIKGDNVSKDEKDKSKRRREQELRFEQTSTPPNIPILLWSFFMELNVPVFFTYQESFDDTIVSYAQQSKAIILTSNQKLFKYKNREFRIFEKYKISQNGSISFVPLRNMKNWQKEKPILPAPAKVLTKDLLSYLWPMKKELIMGCPTPFVRRFGNPYLTLRPLRQAVYVRLGIKKMIEVIPFWDKQNGSVEWDKTLVKPDAKLDNLLDNPLEAVEAMFEVSKLKKPEDCPINMWKNYLYCLHVLVFEICCIGKDNVERNIFELVKITAKNFVKWEIQDSQQYGLFRKEDEYFPKEEQKIQKKENLNILTKVCNTCHKNFEIPPGEAKFFKENNLKLPKRCKECRKAKIHIKTHKPEIYLKNERYQEEEMIKLMQQHQKPSKNMFY